MPSARELLEQADVMMRRNRARAIDTEIPELTDVVPLPEPIRSATPITLDDVPELTDAVEEIEIASIIELPEDAGEVSEWLRFDRGELGVTGGAPESDATSAPLQGFAARQAPAPTPVSTPVSTPVPTPVDESARWEALADEIRTQVLLRLDTRSDSGLGERLSGHLRPIVDRASAELVAAIDTEIRTFLRSYVTDVVEQEVERLRKGSV